MALLYILWCAHSLLAIAEVSMELFIKVSFPHYTLYFIHLVLFALSLCQQSNDVSLLC